MKNLFALLALAASLAVAGCGKKDKSGSDVSDSAGTALLQYVPADTPYIYAMLTPTPDEVSEKLEPLIETIAPAIQSQLRLAADAMKRDDGDSPAVAVLEALAKRSTPDVADEFGFSGDDTAVFYGNGLLPVARMTMTDPAKFETAFGELADELGLEPSAAKAGDLAYDAIALGEAVSLLVARKDKMLTLAIAPNGLESDALAELLGASKPGQSIVDGGALAELAQKYGYTSHGLGFIDLEAIMSVFINGPSGLDAKLLALADEPPPELSAECRVELTAVSQVAPRLTIGYTELDGKQMVMVPTLELRSDIASALQPVAGNIPGMNSPGTGLMKIAFAMDIKALRGFVESKVDAILDNPYQCEQLGQLNATALQLQQGLQQPLPPMAYNFKGMVIDVETLDGIDFDNPGIPEQLDLSVLLAFDNVSALLQMGQMMLPPLAAVEIAPDGKAIELPPELLQGYPSSVFAAMTDDSLAFATGAGSERKASAMVSAEAEGESAVLGMAVDMAAYAGFMNDLQSSVFDDITESMEAVGGDNPEAADAAASLEAMSETSRAMQEAYGKVFDREIVHIRITPNGFELPTVITFQ